MIRILLPLFCAALGVAASSWATTPAPSAPTAKPPASADVRASTSTRSARRASTLIGLPVMAADGRLLGKVKDIIFDREGRATHVVIAYDPRPQAGPEEIPEGKTGSAAAEARLLAIPWVTAVANLQDGKLVFDGTKLQSAPSFTVDAWPNFKDPTWSATADAYWRKVAPPPQSARHGAPIDPTARLRTRPTRDGD